MWSIGYIVPVHKKGNVNDPSNYRGITISSCLGKLFALIMKNRLKTYILENQIIPKCQIGFIKHKHTFFKHLLIPYGSRASYIKCYEITRLVQNVSDY